MTLNDKALPVSKTLESFIHSEGQAMAEVCISLRFRVVYKTVSELFSHVAEICINMNSRLCTLTGLFFTSVNKFLCLYV